MNYLATKFRAWLAAQNLQRGLEFGGLSSAERAQDVLLGAGQDLTGPGVSLPAGRGEHGADAAAIGGVGAALDEAILLQPVDELRDIGTDALLMLGELAQRHPCPGVGQMPQQPGLGERQPHVLERGLEARL